MVSPSHIWTYAYGLSDDHNDNGAYNCPCAKSPGAAPPDYVGLDYFCESGNHWSMAGQQENTHFGMVMDVVQATAAVHRLGCRGSVGPSHRK